MIDKIKQWRISMKEKKLPFSAANYYMFNNICPACRGAVGTDCPHCRGEGTYSAYMNKLLVDPMQAYRASVQRSEELLKIAGALSKEKQTLIKEVERLTAMQEAVKGYTGNIERELDHILDTKNKASLTKIQAWLAALKEML